MTDALELELPVIGSTVAEVVPLPETGAECVWVAMTVLPLLVSVQSVV